MRRLQPFALVMALAIAFLAGGLVVSSLMVDQPLLAQEEPKAPAAEAPQQATAVQPSSVLMGNPYLIADIAEAAKHAVVMITVEWPAPERMPQTYDPWSWFFWDFFGPYYEAQPTVTSGSGFLFDPEGYIFTNQHVVGDKGQGQKIKVRLHPDTGIEQELEAELVGSDYELDLAVIKLKDVPEQYRGKLPILEMGDSDAARQGEWVIAIGNPYGYEHTVTVGSLSAKGRQIRIYDEERRQWKTYRDLLQTDAAINRGNSGGPLINIEGKVIGINTAVSANAQGIGFAIPINTARAVVNDLIEKGYVTRTAEATERYVWHTQTIPVVLGRDPVTNRPLLGVQIQSVTKDWAAEVELPEARGARVVSVQANTAAAQAGIQVGDVIIAFDGQRIDTSEDLVAAVQARRPGQRVMITLWRYGVEPRGRSSV